MQISGATLVSASIKTNKDGVPIVKLTLDAEAEEVDVGELARLIGTKLALDVRSPQPLFDYADLVAAGTKPNEDGID